MNGAKARDRLQPALIDRLRDDDPNSSVEPVERQILSRQQLRDAVLRDLAWLFNSTTLGDDSGGLPYVRGSVIYYGLPAWSGFTASSLEVPQMQEAIRAAIVAHEPRLLADSVQVEAVLSDDQLDWHNQLSFRISAQLWAQPIPIELLVQTDVDLETGHVAVRDVAR